MFSDRVYSYLQDIIDDADRLPSYVEGQSLEELSADEITLLAVERLFQRITEAVIRIGAADMARIGPDIPVERIRAFGNRLRHDYANIDPALLLQTATEDLPILRAAAARALAS